jgi:hypothetical protein
MGSQYTLHQENEMTKIEEAITAYWGEKCAEYEEGCPVCEAWAEYKPMCRISVTRPIFGRIADIGPGGKEYNVKYIGE